MADHASIPSNPTVLVFDSGLGGLTVLREIAAARRDFSLVFAADDAGFPYGPRSDGDVIARVDMVIDELIGRFRPDLVVIACNTASTLVLPPLRAKHKIPFVGTVPAIKPACAQSKTKRITVLATPGTVKRDYTRDLIREFAGGCHVDLVGSPNLAQLAEAALRGEAVSDETIAKEIAPAFVEDGSKTDTIVLACTHYPLLLDRFRKLAPWPVEWIDPAPAIARRVASLLPKAGVPLEGPVKAYFTAGAAPAPALTKALKGFVTASGGVEVLGI